MKPSRFLGVLGLSLVGTGCTATFVDRRVEPAEEKSAWLDYYLVGAAGHEELDVRDLCASGRAREIRLGSNALTLGLSIVTLGIYTPRRAAITCGRTPGAKP